MHVPGPKINQVSGPKQSASLICRAAQLNQVQTKLARQLLLYFKLSKIATRLNAFQFTSLCSPLPFGAHFRLCLKKWPRAASNT